MTFARRPAGISALLLLASISGCADMPAARLADSSPARDSPAPYGVIVSVRPVTATRGDMRGVILGALGSAAPPARDDMVEIIVRRQDGQAISLVRPNTASFHAGERILLTRGASTQTPRPDD